MSIKDYLISPTIIEERKLNVTSISVFDRLLIDRIIFLGTEIDDDVANIIQAQLLYLSSISLDDITLYINSPGGSVTAGLGIYDTIQHIKPKVNTICTGLAASMAAVLLCSGNIRSALPHSKIMIHQPMSSVSGQATDILIEAEEIKKCKDEIAKLLAHHCHQDLNKILKDIERDNWFTSQEAVQYGLIDKVL